MHVGVACLPAQSGIPGFQQGPIGFSGVSLSRVALCCRDGRCDQKLLQEKRVSFTSQFTARHPSKARQELKAGAGSREQRDSVYWLAPSGLLRQPSGRVSHNELGPLYIN